MLSIRLQRTGRKNEPHYRVVVQDSHTSPTSGKFVAHLGHYNPHTKTAVIDKEKAETYLKNGAQPSERIVRLFTTEKITLPDWVNKPEQRVGKLRNPEKLRKNQPAPEEPAVEAEAAPAEAETDEVAVVEEAATEAKEAKEEAATEEVIAEAEAEGEATVETSEEAEPKAEEANDEAAEPEAETPAEPKESKDEATS